MWHPHGSHLEGRLAPPLSGGGVSLTASLIRGSTSHDWLEHLRWWPVPLPQRTLSKVLSYIELLPLSLELLLFGFDSIS